MEKMHKVLLLPNTTKKISGEQIGKITDRWEKNPEFYAKVPSRYTPIGDVADGTDVADAVFYFAAHARNTTGAELVVDGGNTIQLYPVIPEN